MPAETNYTTTATVGLNGLIGDALTNSYLTALDRAITGNSYWGVAVDSLPQPLSDETLRRFAQEYPTAPEVQHSIPVDDGWGDISAPPLDDIRQAARAGEWYIAPMNARPAPRRSRFAVDASDPAPAYMGGHRAQPLP